MDGHVRSPSATPRTEHPEATTVATLACGGGTCPTVYRTADGAYLVQGRPVDPASVGLDVPAGEALVEVPEALLEQLREGGRRAD